MKRKTEYPDIPMLKNAAVAVNIDLKKKKERIIIGDLDKINRYIRGMKSENILLDEVRPIGTFLLDFVPKGIALADIRANMSNALYHKGRVSTHSIESLYTEENPLYKYLALTIWKEFEKARDTKSDDFMDTIEDLALPFRYSLMKEILKWQKMNTGNPLAEMLYEYFKYPVQTLLVADGDRTIEWTVSDGPLMSIVVYYLRMIYEKKKYFNYCKVCGKLFLAPDVSKTTMCSAKCRKQQQKKNKQKFEDKAKELSYEQAYRNDSMYWYNRITKAKKLGADEKTIAAMQERYAEFRREALYMKREISNGNGSQEYFIIWLLRQRDVIDDIMAQLT